MLNERKATCCLIPFTSTMASHRDSRSWRPGAGGGERTVSAEGTGWPVAVMVIVWN